MPKKLIEVSLPLEEINKAAAREKSIRHGHPSTLHLWWARRPLAAARAVIFASLITDPSDPDYPWESDGPHDDDAIDAERARLHTLIVDLVQWENSTNEEVLNQARAEILKHTNGNPPPLLDPFAGGGAIPLEAQRLGLEAHASDLNPVAVLINKAMIEIPPKFAVQAPVNPDQQGRTGMGAQWKGAAGLANDVRYYGKWMRDEAEKRIGHLYPKVQLPKEQGGGEATVIAWLWARTVTCPNPACGAEMPLISSWWLSKKKGNKTWIEPEVNGNSIQFHVRKGKEGPGDPPKKGRGGTFSCLVCGNLVDEKNVKSQGKAGGMGETLISIVAEGIKGRSYIAPTADQTETARSAKPLWRPTSEQPKNPRWFSPPGYGLTTFGDLFTNRQLVALTTFSDLVGEARERVLADALAAGRPADDTRLEAGGSGAAAYADAVATYLAFAVDRLAESSNTISRWQSTGDKVAGAFGRQAIPMVWDFAEVNPFSGSTRNFGDAVSWVRECIEVLPASVPATASQCDAVKIAKKSDAPIVSTDPPYYDNIGYADLSDFFYVWLKRTAGEIWPSTMGSLLVPKAEELVATPYRFAGGREEADRFFENGLFAVFNKVASLQDREYPVSIYYAFKQSETVTQVDGTSLVSSTGWETMLAGVMNSGFQVIGTWPLRTERGARMVATDTNALASSIVLACRVRPENAPEATRQQFLREMRQRLANDLRPLQHANIAPVDLAQAAIGPGMAIYSKYRAVREANGDPLKVRTALALINQVLDEVLAEQDEEYDNDTRWAISWYESHAMNEGPYGEAEGFARRFNVGTDHLARIELVKSGRGKVRFVWREEYPDLPPAGALSSLADWQIMQHLAKAIDHGQDAAAAVKSRIDADLPGRTDTARDLAYRIYNIAERKGWNREALVYNTLVQNWNDIDRLADDITRNRAQTPQQATLT